MTMECEAIEPAHAARYLVVRDRYPKGLHPREFSPNLTASDFSGSLECEVGHVVVRATWGTMQSKRGAPKRAGANRQTPTARQCARLPVA
jgi:hypothetical protein